jgi:diacylglycerol kinase family enzyme
LIIQNESAGDEALDPDELVKVVAAAGYDAVRRAVDDDRWRAEIGDADLACAVGGDGTVQQVFVAAAGLSVPIAVVPGGTANNIARALHIPLDDPLGQLAAMVGPNAAAAAFDVPLLSIDGRNDRFVEAVGAGVFASLLAGQDALSGNDDGLRRLGEILDEAEEQPWRVEADFVDCTGDYIAVEAMNINESGPNILLAPDADTGDGMIDLVLLERSDRKALQHFIDCSPVGDASLAMQFRTVRCREVVLHVPARTRLRRDDQVEIADRTTTATIRTDGMAVSVVLPGEC